MISQMIASAEGRSLLVRADAADFLHGALDAEAEPGGWVRPLRFLPPQVRALGSCQAWHPGLYRQMARTAAGVSIEFETNASRVALELVPDEEPVVTCRLRERIFAPAESFDGVACEVDGRGGEPGWGEVLAVSIDGTGEDAGPLPQGARLVSFVLDGAGEAPGAVQVLPGFGATHHVRIWLPCLRGVRVRGLWGDGTAFTPVDPRPSLLAIGDGPTQGMACGNPALAWPTRLSERLGFDLVNQGIHRQVFQSGMLSGLGAVNGIAGVVVALGAAAVVGERCGKCNIAALEHNPHCLRAINAHWGVESQRLPRPGLTLVESHRAVHLRGARAAGAGVDGQRIGARTGDIDLHPPHVVPCGEQRSRQLDAPSAGGAARAHAVARHIATVAAVRERVASDGLERGGEAVVATVANEFAGIEMLIVGPPGKAVAG